MSRNQLANRLAWLSELHAAALAIGRVELAAGIRRRISLAAGQLRQLRR